MVPGVPCGRAWTIRRTAAACSTVTCVPDYDIRTYAIVELGSILESGHDLGLFTHALAPYNRLV